jgi:Ni/Co efflux regulator RcnB
MKRMLITAAALTLAGTFAIGTAASAQRYEDHHRENGYHEHYGDRGYGDRGHGYNDRGYYHGGGYRPTAYRGWHDRSDWRRGGYVAYNDWDSGYRVDYGRYHLRRPPYGYEWRRVGDNYVLAAIATGLIADMVNGY